MRLFRLLLFGALFGAVPDKTLASDVLARMNGEWQGRGWVQRTLDGPRETIRCRTKNSYIDVSRRLVVKGLCALPGRKFKMEGTVSRAGDTNRISGRWSNPFGVGSTSVDGTENGDSVTVAFSARDRETGELLQQSMDWTTSDVGFQMTVRTLEGEQFQRSSVEFKRR